MAANLTRTFTLLSILALLLSACNLPGGGTVVIITQPPPDAIYTAAALTLAAQLTNNAPLPITPSPTLPEQPVVLVESPTVTATLVEVTPTVTFTETPIFTPTSTDPTISASMNTNCRSGPGPEYPVVGYLKVGEVSTVHGKNSSSSWWYIANLAKPGQYCWVWGETTSAVGNIVALPVLTPPPPPATATSEGTAFGSSFAGKHKCGGVWYAYFSVKNNGSSLFDSAAVKIRDLTTDVILSSSASDNPFLSSTSKCLPGADELDSGESDYVAGSIDPYPDGHDIKATITLCTKEGLGGSCETLVIKFTAD